MHIDLHFCIRIPWYHSSVSEAQKSVNSFILIMLNDESKAKWNFKLKN